MTLGYNSNTYEDDGYGCLIPRENRYDGYGCPIPKIDIDTTRYNINGTYYGGSGLKHAKIIPK